MLPRGPDAEGLWHSEQASLGHRRLAIIDLDPRAHQPMHSSCGRFSIVFNGEIYNHRELRAELEREGVVFRTTSDTEVLLESFARDGEKMLPRLRGMFAIAVWDRLANRLFIARDPYGIKPLYYAETSTAVLVGSQVRALLATGLVPREPDLIGQAGFWLTGSVPEPYTWFRDIRALRAGHCAWVENGRLSSPRQWWDVREDWRRAEGATLPAREVEERVREALRASVRAHLVADVSVGIFLSGGIDSGALAGLLAEERQAPLKAVTLAFREFAGRNEDETPLARHLAKHFGLEAHVRTVTREEFLDDLPRIFDAMDQPTVDGINTWYASKAAAELGLKVVVSGVGGDELFQGYNHFNSVPKLVGAWSRLARLPGAIALANELAAVQARRTGNLRWRQLPVWAQTLPGAWLSRRGLFSPEELTRLMGSSVAEEVLQAIDPVRWISDEAGELPREPRLALSLLESTLYLRNQLLRDSDWASMAHSIELRTPLVDASLLRQLRPVAGAFHRFPQKSLLARAPARGLPEAVIRRAKVGFTIPVRDWLPTNVGPFAAHPSFAWAQRVASTYSATVGN